MIMYMLGYSSMFFVVNMKTMINSYMNEDIDDLIKELKENKPPIGVPLPDDTPTQVEQLTDETMEDFILRKSSMLIQQGIDTIEKVKLNVVDSAEPEIVEAYSKLIASVSTSLEILNKIHIQNKKSKAAKELKELDINNSKLLLDKYDKKSTVIENQTNIMVASREEIMKALATEALKKAELVESKKTIDVS